MFKFLNCIIRHSWYGKFVHFICDIIMSIQVQYPGAGIHLTCPFPQKCSNYLRKKEGNCMTPFHKFVLVRKQGRTIMDIMHFLQITPLYMDEIHQNKLWVGENQFYLQHLEESGNCRCWILSFDGYNEDCEPEESTWVMIKMITGLLACSTFTQYRPTRL